MGPACQFRSTVRRPPEAVLAPFVVDQAHVNPPDGARTCVLIAHASHARYTADLAHVLGCVVRPSTSYTAVPTKNLIRTVRVADRACLGPATHVVREHLGREVDARWRPSDVPPAAAACAVFRRQPSVTAVRRRGDGSCGGGRPRAAAR